MGTKKGVFDKKYKDPPYVLGPIPLGGEKSGDEFSVEIQHVWDWHSNDATDASFSHVLQNIFYKIPIFFIFM